MARILIVDDDEMDRVLLAGVLHRGGHEPLFAQNGLSALKIWEKKPADLVVTDIVMPELNGLRLIQSLREEDPWVRVIAISGSSQSNLDLAKESGALAVLKKPVDPQELADAIEKALKNHQDFEGSVLL